MSYIIYGLRMKGDAEVRYIGQTAYEPSNRLATLIREAGYASRPSPFSRWLIENATRTEAFEIRRVETRELARRAERDAVDFCLRLNHRLFNQWLVPANQRIADRTAVAA